MWFCCGFVVFLNDIWRMCRKKNDPHLVVSKHFRLRLFKHINISANMNESCSACMMMIQYYFIIDTFEFEFWTAYSFRLTCNFINISNVNSCPRHWHINYSIVWSKLANDKNQQFSLKNCGYFQEVSVFTCVPAYVCFNRRKQTQNIATLHGVLP